MDTVDLVRGRLSFLALSYLGLSLPSQTYAA
jgi:hypothetical protein